MAFPFTNPFLSPKGLMQLKQTQTPHIPANRIRVGEVGQFQGSSKLQPQAGEFLK